MASTTPQQIQGNQQAYGAVMAAVSLIPVYGQIIAGVMAIASRFIDWECISGCPRPTLPPEWLEALEPLYPNYLAQYRQAIEGEGWDGNAAEWIFEMANCALGETVVHNCKYTRKWTPEDIARMKVEAPDLLGVCVATRRFLAGEKAMEILNDLWAPIIAAQKAAQSRQTATNVGLGLGTAAAIIGVALVAL